MSLKYLEISLQDFETHLVSNYPLLYREIKSIEDIGPGWFQLIDELSANLELMISRNIGSEDPDLPIQLSQCKQKFGCLRFYVDNPTNEMLNAIAIAENISENLCEECSRPGEAKQINYWIRRLCRDCEFLYAI